MKKHLFKITIFSLLLMVSHYSNAQFQGSIQFEKTVGSMNINYKYYVKENKVRIEEISASGVIEGIQLVDIKENKVFAISPERKLYLEAPVRRPAADMKVAVNKTEKVKTILGQDCQQIIVINKEQDRKIVYWVTEGNYSFFIPLLESLNRKEKQALYYLKIKGLNNYWPMKSLEYVLSTGDLVSEMITKIIDETEQSTSLFEIPNDYSKFEH